MPIVTLTEVSLAFGHHTLLDNVDFQISAGDRICLVGRNGVGKSTLLRVISGGVTPDAGSIWRKETLRVSHLEQDVTVDGEETVFDMVASGLGELGGLLSDFHRVSMTAESDKKSLSHLAYLQRQIDVADGWNIEQKVLAVCSRLSLPQEQNLKTCSGGVQRRVMLAKALISSPDLLLLDEPTNHMDIDAITWLEDFLSSFHGALVFITHDRTLLGKLARKIIDLDRGKLTTFAGDFDLYQRQKELMLETESRADSRFDKELAAHEAWIRKGVRARRARNEGRVRKLLAMRKQKQQRLQARGNVKITANVDEMSGKRVLDLQHVTFYYDQACVIRDCSTSILRGDRVGIVGPNGAGKTTLLRIMLGELEPTTGRVATGSHLKWSYFDQRRSKLNTKKTVRENVNDGHDYVRINGKSRHVVGYLKEFLFPRQRIDSPVDVLSGGERNRLLLAKIFTQPANVMVLDEPTNDLDVETLELLEDLLSEYEGTLLLVSHDRAFLDNVVSSILVFEGEGRVVEYVGGYADWIRQRPTPLPKVVAKPVKTDKSKRHRRPTVESSKKLSYKEKRELAALPAEIEALEQIQSELEQKMGESDFYKQDKNTITSTVSRIEVIRKQLERSYQRWEYLDSLAGP